MKNPRIIFLGTPEFAVESLKALVEAGKNVVAVITAPDKPQGRGKKLGESAVKQYAKSVDLPILQPTNLKNPEFIEELKGFKADIQVVVAFRMLPEIVWDMPPLGTFNLHASLLPQYRGAAPINWAIINGEKETGVTTFFLKHEIDTGNIIFQEREPIQDSDTVGDLYARLMKKGASLVVKTIDAIEKEEYELKPQNENQQLNHAPKIFKEDCEIYWKQSSKKVHDFIRGLSPYPAAWTKLDGKQLKVFKTHILDEKPSGAPGTIQSDGKNYIKYNTADGLLQVQELQLEGKKRMQTGDFLRGYPLKPGG